jgi:hypothetical protein
LEMAVSQTICWGWSGITIFLISAFQVARIIDMYHWHLAFVGVCVLF